MPAFVPFVSQLPTATGLPVRRIVRRSHGGYVAEFASTKSDVPIECESLLELDFVRLCEIDPLITGILQQPCEITWLDADRLKHKHIPDFAVQHVRGRFLFEVKTWKKARDPRVVARKAPMVAALAPYGIKYRVVTDRTIRCTPMLANAKIVLKGLKTRPLESDRLASLAVVEAAPAGISLEAVCQALSLPLSFCNCLLSMVIERDLEIVSPLCKPIGDVPSILIRRRTGRLS